MEQEILAELTQIRWILLGLFATVFLSVMYFVVTLAFRVRQANTQWLLLIRDNYIAEMTLLEMKGNYKELFAKSEEMIGDYPNDLMANWYKALASRKTGQLGAALSALGRIKEINSSWSADAVDDLIADIRSEMSGPRALDT